MMEEVKRGGDRQEIHERVRIHAKTAADLLKAGATRNELFDRMASDPLFRMSGRELRALAQPEAFVGLSQRQVEQFIATDVDPLLEKHRDLISAAVGEVRV